MAVPISSIMTRDVVAVDPHMNLRDLDRILVLYGVSGAPVVEDGMVVGVVSRADVIRALYDERLGSRRVSGFYTSPYPSAIPTIGNLIEDYGLLASHLMQMTVREIMSRDVKHLSPDDDVRVAARMMSENGYHRVPILDGAELVGIVTSLDLVRLLGSMGEAVAL